MPSQAERKPPSARIVKRWRGESSGLDKTVGKTTVFEVRIGFEDFVFSRTGAIQSDARFDVHEFVRSKATHG